MVFYQKRPNMVIQQIAVLSLLIIQVISAPTGCIESCGTYFKQYETSGHFEDHGLQSASQLQGPEYSKPGTWSEHNDYNVDNGHGKVHEERGQYVAGPKTVRYYKKNYTSSYSTRYGEGLSDTEQQNSNYRQGVLVPNIMQSSSQRVYDQVGHSESTAQQQRYNIMQSQQRLQSSHRSDIQSERLEDFGEHIGDSQVLQHGLSDSNTQISQVPYYSDTQPGNWSKVDSYKTDGGHGHVVKVEGQYVTGPKKVRYYTKNYTSSYSSHGGIPEPVGIGVEDIRKEIDKLHREIGVQTVKSSDTASTNMNVYDLSNLHNMNSKQYGSRNNFESSSSLIQNEQQLHQPTSEHVIIRNPSQSSYEVNSRRMYEKHQAVSQLINPTPGYTNVLNTGSSAHTRNAFNTVSQHQIDNRQETGHLNTHQSSFDQSGMFPDHLRQTEYNQNSAIHSGTGQSAHYQEHWSRASHIKETSVPQYTTGVSHLSDHNMQYNSKHDNLHGTHQTLQQDSYLNQLKENRFNSGHQTQLGKLVTGVLDLGAAGDTVDCAYNSQYDQHSSQYKMKYKRGIKDDQEVDDTFQQHSYQPWKPGSTIERLKNLPQQTSQEEDLTQQTSGGLEFDHGTQQTYQSWRPHSANQQYEDYTQQVSAHDDFTQQTSGKLEFEQESQQTYQPWKLDSASQHSEDLTQQTSKYDDFSQETLGKLELGQESQSFYEPQWPGRDEYSGDYTQQVSAHDNFNQQMSGKLELEQQSHHTWKPNSANKQEEDLIQQTSDHDDLTQQTSGNLEFGQHSYQPWKPSSANQEADDLTQQTGDHDDLTQQTSGKFEFGQHSHQPRKPNSGNQRVRDLTTQTSDLDDFTQQTSGKLEFGQESQQSYQPRKPSTANQETDDLTQQTDDHDDLTQQTSRKLEFGQQSYQPRKPNSGNQRVEDSIQQTSGKLEFGQESQQSYQSWKPSSVNQGVDDLTQQTGDHDDLTQQTSGKLELGQHSYQPWKPSSANQEVDDLTQQTGDHDDFTQQTSGKLEFGQHSYQPWKPGNANQEVDDLTQQTGGYDDFTQQTSGKLEFGQDYYQPWKPSSADQVDDFTQQTDDHDDLIQQTSGKLEFGQESQHSYHGWQPNNAGQYSEDLTQQTGMSDDFTQQSGKLEFGQQSQVDMHQGPSSPIPKPAGKPKPRSRYSRTGTAGNIQIQNQNMYNTNNQKSTDHKKEDTDIPNIYEIPAYVNEGNDRSNVRNLEIRGDQGVPSSNKNNSRDLSQQTAINAYNVEGENVDQVNWLHKSNDATHTSEQQETQDKHLFDDLYQQSSDQNNEASHSYLQSQIYASGQAAKFDQDNQQTSDIMNEQQHRSTANNHQLKPRILEAYGGGPYDESHDDTIYYGITINPSATLPPINSADPWDIREKPWETTLPPMPVEPLITNYPTEESTPPPSFWSKLGYKITNTFGKAKEKARTIFG